MATQCNGFIYNGDKCTRDILSGTEWCIFHYPNKDETLTQIFQENFVIELENQLIQHPKYVDFTGFDFPIEFSYEKQMGSVIDILASFAVFREKVTLRIGIINGYFASCVFHKHVSLKNITIIGLAQFSNATFMSSADFQDAHFGQGVMFDNVLFKNNVEFSGANFANRDAWFDDSIFEMDANFNRVSFNSASFYSCSFKDKASFYATRFNFSTFIKANFHSVSFWNAEFNQSLKFNDVVVQEHLDCRGASFHDGGIFNGALLNNSNFSYSIFATESTFKNTTLKGNTSFRNTVFDIVRFNETVLIGSILFIESVFNKFSWFTNIKINAFVSFYQTTFRNRLFLRVNKWGPDLENEIEKVNVFRIEYPIFEEYGNIIISGPLGLIKSDYVGGISLLNSYLEKIDFIDEIWIREEGKSNRRKLIVDEIFLIKQIKDNSNEPYKITPDQVSQTYRRIREKFEKLKRYSEAGDFLIGELEITRKYTLDQTGKVQHKSWMDSEKILLTLFRIFSQYGESIASPLLWSIIIIVGSSIILSFLELPKLFAFTFPFALRTTLSAFFPFFRIDFEYPYLFIRSFGTLFIGLIYVAIRRKLERR